MPHISILSTKTYKDYGRLDIRNLDDNYFQESPVILDAGEDILSAKAILLNALDLDDNNKIKIITTPIGIVNINSLFLDHIVEKRNDARERYSNFILPTLCNPFEIYNTQYTDGFRHQFIGLFKGNTNLLVVVKINASNNLMWNIMHTDRRIMNKHRRGDLIFFQP